MDGSTDRPEDWGYVLGPVSVAAASRRLTSGLLGYLGGRGARLDDLGLVDLGRDAVTVLVAYVGDGQEVTHFEVIRADLFQLLRDCDSDARSGVEDGHLVLARDDGHVELCDHEAICSELRSDDPAVHEIRDRCVVDALHNARDEFSRDRESRGSNSLCQAESTHGCVVSFGSVLCAPFGVVEPSHAKPEN
jgi:hypothetical protein